MREGRDRACRGAGAARDAVCWRDSKGPDVLEGQQAACGWSKVREGEESGSGCSRRTCGLEQGLDCGLRAAGYGKPLCQA